MSLNESITELLKAQTIGITLGIHPETGKTWATMQHLVETEQNCRMEITHKVEGASVTEVVQKLCESYNRAEQNRKKIEQPAASKILKI